MRPLDGIRVLDLSRVLAGPFCSLRLADLGARVIKVESPDGDPTRRFGPPFAGGESPYFMAFNRGKEDVVLDLAQGWGREAARRLLARADVLLDNFRPGALEGFGLGEDARREVAPELVHVTFSGYGAGAPAGRPAFDLAVQAESGLMRMTGPEDGEICRVPVSLADLAAGLAGAEACLAALLRRARGGGGARIEISLLDALVGLFGYQAQSALMTGEDPRRLGHRHPNLVPYQAFATADAMLVVAVATDVQWRRLLEVEGMPAELGGAAWATNRGRVEDREALVPVLEAALSREPTATWIGRLDAAGVPWGRVRSLTETLADLAARGDGFLRQVVHRALGPVTMVGSPIVMDGARGGSDAPPPVLDQHGDAILAEAAADEDELARWRREREGAR